LLSLVVSIWLLGLTSWEAKALTIVELISPADSAKVTTGTPTFEWEVEPGENETPIRFHIKLALDPSFTSIIWEDSTIEGSVHSVVYDGPSLTEWEVYYWSVWVQVEVEPDTFWQEDFPTPFIFIYTTATLFHIYEDPSISDLPTIQEAIAWAAPRDTILVEPGVYYENVQFYKDNLLVTSTCCPKPDSIDTTIINSTIIDGSKLTGGENKGSVIYFASGVDSNSTLRGFTIQGGKGTKARIGGVQRISGGGIFCDERSSPTIAYNVITGNRAENDGGGIFINSAAPNILHNIITRNSTVKGSGGGIECFFSIKIGASGSLSPSGQNPENEGAASLEVSESNGENKNSLSPSKSSLKKSGDEIKNSLNPRDATDVSAPGSLGKPVQNDPPVAVFDWYARRDTIIQRDKYLPGDTLFFDGSQSLPGDPGGYIQNYRWFYNRYYRCWEDPEIPYRSLGFDSVYTLAITQTSSDRGVLRVFLQVRDNLAQSSNSDTITFNIQYPPHPDAEGMDAAPGDTVWLDGSESCDVNPDDILLYNWTQLSGPVSITIQNPDSAKAYFVPEDTAYLGSYEFQLKVTDSMDADSATVQVSVSRPPVAVCQDDPVYGDTLVGFTSSDAPYTASDTMILNACLSWDPDSSSGDQVQNYLWERVEWCFPTKDTIQCLLLSGVTLSRGSAVCESTLTYAFGGLLKFRLKVKDSFGITSENRDSVILSVQTLPFANAGNDTVLRPKNKARLTGQGIEINPDQRNSLRYYWRRVSGPTFKILPSDTVQSINFTASFPGIYKLSLTVRDDFGICKEDDQVIVVANELPVATVVPVAPVFEGDTVHLDASSSYDPDSATFQHPDSSDAGGLTFKWSVKSKPDDAEEPVIVDQEKPIAKFVPYGTGTYQFHVLVNDTISKRQIPEEGVNLRTLTVSVESTYAYPVIQGNLISHNFSASRGGGISCNRSSPDVINNIFYKNQSTLSGGAISGRNVSTPQIKSNIFFGNISSDSTGGAIADLKAQLSPSATRGFRKSLAIQHNDFWDNRGGALYQASGNISDNIYSFPRLIDPDFGDFRFECTSPCFGAGDPLHPDIGSLIYFQPCSTATRLGTVSLSLFRNPVATAVADLIVNTDVPLKAPPVAYVTIGDLAPSLVRFAPISSKSYRGSFVFTASGIADISVFASSLVERDTTVVETFSVVLVGAGNSSKLASCDEKMKVLFPEGSVKEDIYATCICVSKDPRYRFEDQPEMSALGEAYQLGPSISFDKHLTISFPLDALDLEDKDKTLFSVYKYEDGKWNRLESFLDGNSVCAKVRSLGVYRLIYDPRGKHIAGVPKTYQLFQNYPNPFNPETQIRYDLPASGHVKLTIYNILGQRVKVLIDEIQDAGHKSVIWDGRDNDGREVASGIYFYKIKAESYQKTMKMVLLK